MRRYAAGMRHVSCRTSRIYDADQLASETARVSCWLEAHDVVVAIAARFTTYKKNALPPACKPCLHASHCRCAHPLQACKPLHVTMQCYIHANPDLRARPPPRACVPLRVNACACQLIAGLATAACWRTTACICIAGCQNTCGCLRPSLIAICVSLSWHLTREILTATL